MKTPIKPVDLTAYEREQFDLFCSYMQDGPTKLELEDRVAIATWRAGVYRSRILKEPLRARLSPPEE